MIKAVFWDWNGTIWDDRAVWFKAAKAAYGVVGVELTLEKLLNVFDVPITIPLDALGVKPEDREELHRVYCDVFTENAHEARLRDGAEKALQALCHSDNYIISNHYADMLWEEVSRAGIAKFFTDILGNSEWMDVTRKATKQEKIEGILTARNLEPGKCLIIGDTIEEIRIGKKLGLVTVGLGGGCCSKERLAAMSPDYLVDNLSDMVTCILPDFKKVSASPPWPAPGPAF